MVLAGFKTESDDKLALKPPCQRSTNFFTPQRPISSAKSLLQQQRTNNSSFPQIKQTRKNRPCDAVRAAEYICIHQHTYTLRSNKINSRLPHPATERAKTARSRNSNSDRGRKNGPGGRRAAAGVAGGAEAAVAAAPGHFARAAGAQDRRAPPPRLPLGAPLDSARRIIRVSSAMEEASASSAAPPPAAPGLEAAHSGPPPAPSPLSGGYLLIILGEPHCEEHKDIILQRLAKGEFSIFFYFGQPFFILFLYFLFAIVSSDGSARWQDAARLGARTPVEICIQLAVSSMHFVFYFTGLPRILVRRRLWSQCVCGD